MVFNGTHADTELLGDFPARPAGDHEIDDTLLARREQFNACRDCLPRQPLRIPRLADFQCRLDLVQQ